MKTESETYMLAAAVVDIILRVALLIGAGGLLYWLFFVAGKASQ